MDDNGVERQWKQLLRQTMPPGELRDLLEKIEIVPDEVPTPQDFIICTDKAIVPSEDVECSQCHRQLVRSLKAPKKPKVICMECTVDLAKQTDA